MSDHENLVVMRNGKARFNEAMEEKTPFPWSASRLKKLLLCPRQFRFAYIDRLPTVVTAPLAFGRAVHDAIKCAHEEQMVTGALPPVGEVIARFDALWEEALSGEVLFRPSHPLPQRYRTMGHEALRVFHALNRDASPPLAVELPFEVEIRGDDDETYLLRGIIDRVDEVRGNGGEGALVIMDYKSGSRKLKPEEAQNDLQLTLYALALQQMLGMPVERVEFHWLRDGQVLASGRDEAAFSHLTGEVLPYAGKTLREGEFPPCPGYWCRWCDFQKPCQQEGIWLEQARPGGEADGLRG